MIPKFKKALKRALIKIYSESKEIDLRLESFLVADFVETDCIFSTHLIGSNKAEFVSILKLGAQKIKLPAILKVFSILHDFKSSSTLRNNSLGAKDFVVHKVDNLSFKTKKYNSIFEDRFKFCLKLRAFITFPLSKMNNF